MLPRSPKTGFLARRNFKKRKRRTMAANSSEPLRCSTICVGWWFPIFLNWNLSRKKPCSTSSSEKMCLRCFQQEVFGLSNLSESMCIFARSRLQLSQSGRRSSCLPVDRLNWFTHKRAQRSCKTCKHKYYCRSIRRGKTWKLFMAVSL